MADYYLYQQSLACSRRPEQNIGNKAFYTSLNACCVEVPCKVDAPISPFSLANEAKSSLPMAAYLRGLESEPIGSPFIHRRPKAVRDQGLRQPVQISLFGARPITSRFMTKVALTGRPKHGHHRRVATCASEDRHQRSLPSIKAKDIDNNAVLIRRVSVPHDCPTSVLSL